METRFPKQVRSWGPSLYSFEMRTTCRYCLAGKQHKIADGGLKPSGTTMPCKWQQKIFVLLSKLELPCGRVWILSWCSTLPPWLLQKWSALQISHLDQELLACLLRMISVLLCAEQQHSFQHLVKLEKTFFFLDYTAILWSEAALGLSPNPKPNKWKHIS